MEFNCDPKCFTEQVSSCSIQALSSNRYKLSLPLTINYTQREGLWFTIRAHGQDNKLDTKSAESGQYGLANYKSADKVALPAWYINNVECCYPQPGQTRQIQDIHCRLCQEGLPMSTVCLSQRQCYHLYTLRSVEDNK